MRCGKCNVEIVCKTDICPLCGENINTSESAAQEICVVERAYPKYTKSRAPASSPFSKIYLITLANIIIVCAVINAVFTPAIYWAAAVAAALIYLYTFIKTSLMKSSRFNARIAANAAALFLFFFIVQQAVSAGMWIYEYIYPSVAFVSMAVLAFYILLNIKVAGRFVSTLALVALMSLLPMCVVFAIDSKVLWPALTVAVLGLSIIITSLFLGGKQIIDDLKRIFHNK